MLFLLYTCVLTPELYLEHRVLSGREAQGKTDVREAYCVLEVLHVILFHPYKRLTLSSLYSGKNRFSEGLNRLPTIKATEAVCEPRSGSSANAMPPPPLMLLSLAAAAAAATTQFSELGRLRK